MVVRKIAYAMLWLAILALGSVVAQAESPPVDAELQTHITGLIRQLGDRAFRRREEATKELTRIGLPARSALQQARADADAEIRDRVRRLLVTVDRAYLDQQIAEFLADTDGEREHDLPGWKRFSESVGSDRAAHQLFAGMVRAEGELLSALDGDPKQLQEKFSNRLQAFQQLLQSGRADNRQQPISLESMATMIFVASDPNVTISDNMVAMLFGQMHQSPFLNSIDRSEGKSVGRDLLRLWILRSTQGLAVQYSLSLALQYNLREEGIVLAEKAITNAGPTGLPPHTALMLLGRFGSTKHLPLLETLLENKTVLWTGKLKKENLSGQVRDLSLAVIVSLTGQDHEAYGFKSLQRNGKQPKDSINTLGFMSDAERDAALAKWQAWKAAHAAELK